MESVNLQILTIENVNQRYSWINVSTIKNNYEIGEASEIFKNNQRFLSLVFSVCTSKKRTRKISLDCPFYIMN
jgi:hypothetical protein